MMTLAEAAVRDADRTEAAQKKSEKELQRTSIEAAKVAVETQIDDDLLGRIASEEGVDSESARNVEKWVSLRQSHHFAATAT